MIKISKALLYCKKAKPYLVKSELYNTHYDIASIRTGALLSTKTQKEILERHCLNGKIVAECDFEVERIYEKFNEFDMDAWFETETLCCEELYSKSCLNFCDISNYLLNCIGAYAIHIKNLHIFDEPKELSDYYTRPKKMNTLDGYSYTNISLDRAPQNMMYCCDEEENNYILISVRPEWMCLILNHIKDVEVRRVVLKEMLNNV